ncbi:MAG TPA: limonene-1,2-epoxide hydrolase family protein [Acidimicrobiales bacterium]|nr:limonene-1,2-epoxide hydrolase family protein [Acidimicrobiales bacterium]
MSDAERVVQDFCDAIGQKDLERCRSLLTEKAVYHNIPMDPVEGLEATVASLAMQFDMFTSIEFRILAMASTGSTVLTERIDFFNTAAGAEGRIPVMGAFEVEDGRIAAWRDYFDMAQAAAALSLGG